MSPQIPGIAASETAPFETLLNIFYDFNRISQGKVSAHCKVRTCIVLGTDDRYLCDTSA